MNEELAYRVVQAAIHAGVREWVVCPGSRNSSFVEVVRLEERLEKFYWPEERSAAYFALGKSRQHKSPVAIVTTSGTAAGELLPAAMEAFYTGAPLLLITADRPPSFRGIGAPQSANQVGLFSHYARTLDLSAGASCDLTTWDRRSPLHLNCCFNEPQSEPPFQGQSLDWSHLESPHCGTPYTQADFEKMQKGKELLDRFFSQVERPIAIVSALDASAREGVAQLLLQLQIPALIEGVSGLREDPRLEPLSLRRTDKIFTEAASHGYVIDGVLRIGGVPTHRVWRDLEYLKESVKVCAISEMPFSGLSWSRGVACVPIAPFLATYHPQRVFGMDSVQAWIASERAYGALLQGLFIEEPLAEPSLIASLSQAIPTTARLYLGNSLPIREWDQMATRKIAHPDVHASRGVNGIDGQISTFLGLCKSSCENWGIVGDLTALYDLVAFWIMKQMPQVDFNLVIVNNGGGMIFKRMYPYQEMLNTHALSFESLAKMWGLAYQRDLRPAEQSKQRIIELIPDPVATERFMQKLKQKKVAV